ncbi:MAG: hypothetical protein RBG13Loki_0055 [Promethearchaeota archaeon CR_4]|nr:MAG: hypothetical protein RBG13Loki_0055 [Candidatus Lokiarchaeota archaeon CR_4]
MIRRRFQSIRVRILSYGIILVGLIIAGLAWEVYRKYEYGYNGPATQSSGGGGGLGFISDSRNNVTFTCSNRPLEWCDEYGSCSYDPSYENDCYIVYLKINVYGNDTFISSTNVTFWMEYGLSYENVVNIPLQYNISRAEYTAQFDVRPYWTLGYIRFALELDTLIHESPFVHRFSLFYNPNNPIPFSWILPAFGVIGIIVIELYIRKILPIKEENRKNQALLSLLRQQNRGVYDQALRQVQEDHKKLMREIQSKDEV